MMRGASGDECGKLLGKEYNRPAEEKKKKKPREATLTLTLTSGCNGPWFGIQRNVLSPTSAWRWRQNFPPKNWDLLTKLCSVTSTHDLHLADSTQFYMYWHWICWFLLPQREGVGCLCIWLFCFLSIVFTVYYILYTWLADLFYSFYIFYLYC
jgi:hypothetical protein